jgi:hypothetical protein
MSNQVSRSFLVLFSAALLVCVVAVAGCSKGGKTNLQGEVTYGGEPVALGAITFTPKGEGHRAVQTITDGKFDISAKNGVEPGEYNVTVEGYVEAPEDDPDQVAKKTFPDYVTSITVEAGKPIIVDVPKE